jgi:hypothetical protein
MRDRPHHAGNGPYDGFYFDAESRWYPGDFDAEQLREELEHHKFLKPFKDELGNPHSAVVLQRDPEDGIWVFVPTGSDWKLIDKTVGAHDAG